MTAIRWPEGLPGPMPSGYSEVRQEARRQVAPEAGPPHMRRRFTSVATFVQMTFRVSLDDALRIERFYVEDIREGTLPFEMPDPLRDDATLQTAVDADVTTQADAPVFVARTRLCSWGASPPVLSVVGPDVIDVSVPIVFLP